MCQNPCSSPELSTTCLFKCLMYSGIEVEEENATSDNDERNREGCLIIFSFTMVVDIVL